MLTELFWKPVQVPSPAARQQAVGVPAPVQP
jgi:hypothetical protein